MYKKEYGLTTEEFYNEPADRIKTFLKIRECEAIRQEKENKKSEKKWRN